MFGPYRNGNFCKVKRTSKRNAELLDLNIIVVIRVEVVFKNLLRLRNGKPIGSKTVEHVLVVLNRDSEDHDKVAGVLVFSHERARLVFFLNHQGFKFVAVSISFVENQLIVTPTFQGRVG